MNLFQVLVLAVVVVLIAWTAVAARMLLKSNAPVRPSNLKSLLPRKAPSRAPAIPRRIVMKKPPGSLPFATG